MIDDPVMVERLMEHVEANLPIPATPSVGQDRRRPAARQRSVLQLPCMADIVIAEIYLSKAEESLAGAEREFASGCYNNTANRCYYTCFQAAVAALIRAGIAPSGRQWSHEFVQAQFTGQLVNRRKVFPAELRQVLSNTLTLRQKADYRGDHVTQREASHGLEWSRTFLAAVRREGETT